MMILSGQMRRYYGGKIHAPPFRGCCIGRPLYRQVSDDAALLTLLQGQDSGHVGPYLLSWSGVMIISWILMYQKPRSESLILGRTMIHREQAPSIMEMLKSSTPTNISVLCLIHSSSLM